ncbi:hypothetical protein PIB30_062828 [Stylosanthes scabra]|uniref:Uncharacterized protein n=1 Tax=Stylosanthes scabra TaxID=79078 RepID=A0ABU6SL79_9FABA|nr:hypothetical protein [Stylosanthes scabra]
MASSSASFDAHRFKSAFHQNLFEEYVAKKAVTSKISFDLEEDQHPEIKEQIANRGWRRLTNPRTKISKLLIQEFYANTARTDEEMEETDFETRQTRNQKLDEVLQELCVPGSTWKLSTSQPVQPIQLKRQDLFPLARG